jgi:hypothetical protein
MLTPVYWAYAGLVILVGGSALALLFLDYERTAVAALFVMIAGFCVAFYFGLQTIDARRIGSS